MHQDYPLQNNYTIFGRVVKGQEVVDKIAEVATGPQDQPLDAVIMKQVIVDSALLLTCLGGTCEFNLYFGVWVKKI
jgi:cyclophilin family peptidyl-prolyl cis-trans isomerase